MDVIERSRQLAEVAGGGWLPPDDVKTLTTDSGMPIQQLMLELIPLASTFAMPKLSGFQVGAVAQGVSGALYFGANFEFDASPLNQTVHAEQATVVNALVHSETGMALLAVSAAPCGYCRQFLFELAMADQLRILLADKPPETLMNLLPGAFGPGDLGIKGGLLSSARHELDWVSSPAGGVSGAAFEAACTSYAPYTGALAGVALITRDGRTFAGPYLENAAFNPSLSPMQAAIVATVLGGHSGAAQLVLKKFAPGVTMKESWARFV